MQPWIAIKKIVVGCALALLSLVTFNAKSQEGAVRPQGIYSSDFVIDGLPRTVSFYIPLSYGKLDTYPVVFFLHPEGETGKSIIKKYGDILQQLADSSACIVVYPDAVKGHWSAKIGEHAEADTINDAGFLAIMADYFVQQYHADPGRVYAVGFFNGGEMAWRFACYMAGKIAAIAPFVQPAQALAKACTPGAYFDGAKYLPPPGKKFNHEAIAAGWQFLMAHRAP